MSMFNYERLDGESDEELIYRVCQDKEILGTWQTVADILNELLNAEYTESKYRKQYQAFQKMFDSKKDVIFDDRKYLAELKLQQQELKKEKQKLSDERVELNRVIREQARRESYEDLIKRVITESVEPIEMNFDTAWTYVSDSDILAHITDIHTGIEIDEYKNKFNQDILKERLERYIHRIIEIRRIHGSQNCYIVVSEVLSGLIHNNLRLQNNMDLIEQFKYISELLSECFVKLSEEFSEVYVYTVMGNHSRISPKKEDSLQGENMDILLPFYLKAKLQNIKNIHIEDNEIQKDAALFSVRGNTVLAVHGDKDNPSTVVQNWTMMYTRPQIVLLGHRHTNGITTVYDSKVIQSGCISGTDEYALSLRKTNKPEQYVNVVDENGLVCSYDVRLD